MELIARYNRKGGKKGGIVLDSENNTSPTDNTLPHDDSGSEVSDHDSNSSMDHAEADNQLDLHHNEHLLNNKESEDVTIESILLNEYEEIEVPTHLPPVSEKLASFLTEWLRTPPSRKRVKEFFKQCMVPVNIDGQNPVRINELLYAKFTFEEKLNDQNLRGINSLDISGPTKRTYVLEKNLKNVLWCYHYHDILQLVLPSRTG